MRDIFIFTAIIIIVFATLRKPQIGILGWLWLSIMNPHKEAYGWIYTMPVLNIIAGATLISVVINFKQMRKTTLHPIVVLLIVFYLWACLSTVFAISYDLTLPKWIEFSKTMLFVFLILLFFNSRHWIISAIWVFIFSVGYTGAKGGIFTVLTGGGTRIWGAPGTMWGDNNGVALAMIMVVPLIFAMKDLLGSKILRLSIYAQTFLSFVTILGTQSRGGLVGIMGTALLYFIRSRHKLVMAVLIFAMAVSVFTFMPASWKNRMETIETYQKDSSASTRILQWRYAVQLAAISPVIGNGFDTRYYQPYYHKYLTGIDVNRAAHSYLFEILEEQGYVGLFIFLLLMATAVVSANRISKKARKRKDLKWASSLLFYSQFSIAGFAFNGLTLSVAYLDLYYYLLAFIVLLISHVNSELAKPVTETDADNTMLTLNQDKPLLITTDQDNHT